MSEQKKSNPLKPSHRVTEQKPPQASSFQIPSKKPTDSSSPKPNKQPKKEN